MGLKEEKVIDFILLLGISGLFFSRITYIFSNLEKFGTRFDYWLLLGRYPGFSFWGGLLGMFLVIKLFCRSEKWDFWRVADEVVFGLLPLFVLSQIGCFLDGCSVGKPTSSFLGVYSPGHLLKRQPVSLFFGVVLFLIWFFLLWVERQWRMWKWYKKDAGFIFLSFCALIFISNLGIAFFRDSALYFEELEIGLSALGFVFTAVYLFLQSPKVSFKKKGKNGQKRSKGPKAKDSKIS